ncbi:Lactonase, 7-bladed beta-propeller-domain-containing protein [Pestalotiopsis sp. NC0098]|nr:Lactonase, 7-bladed beta-propeller-domain-containing protein [Pestalotiopsis sp. NC0098]
MAHDILGNPVQFLCSAAAATNLLVSHFSGQIYSLSLSEIGGRNSELIVSSSTTGCGRLPAWLQYDSEIHTAYCVDENWSANGVVASFSVARNGSLTQTGNTTTAGMSVHSAVYGGVNRRSFIVTSEYTPSTITTYELPLRDTAAALQILEFTMDEAGPNSRQDKPHPHAGIPDPTGDYLLVLDLGADLVRIFTINQTSGELTACGAGVADAGSGPRHGVFWSSSSYKKFYTVNELGNSVTAWALSYPSSGCPTLVKNQTLSTYAEGVVPGNTTKAAEIHIRDNFLYVSNRADETFGTEQDSLVTYTIDPTSGDISWLEASSAYAWYPRSFEINKAGDLVAVGGQTSSNVAIIARDPTTGRLGDLVANVSIATRGTAGGEDGLSAVVWVE